MATPVQRAVLSGFAFLSSWCLAEPDPISFNDDGAWCWYQDERVLIHDGKLIVGSVAAGVVDPSRRGDIEATIYDLTTGEKVIVELHDGLTEISGAYDDHNAPAFLVLPNGWILAAYPRHGPNPHFFYRIAETVEGWPRWSEVRTFVTSPTTRLTYSNLHLLREENGKKGRLYNFFRGLGGTIRPFYAFSDDWGESWTSGNIVIEVAGEQKHGLALAARHLQNLHELQPENRWNHHKTEGLDRFTMSHRGTRRPWWCYGSVWKSVILSRYTK